MMGQRYPVPLPTCTFAVPPVYTGSWDDEAWRGWIARTCQCYGHLAFRQALREEGRIW